LVKVRETSVSGCLTFRLGLSKKSSKKVGILPPFGFLKEIKVKSKKENFSLIKENKKEGIQINDIKLFVGDKIDPRLFFKKGDKITVSGRSKAKGFQGVVKRHKFAGGPKTHGQSDRERAPGSIGNRTTPGRVHKGKRMAGRMGGERVTLKNMLIIEATESILKVKGLVPGWSGGFLEIRKNDL